MRAEQAIYTSAQTSTTRGYHLTSRSPGIDEAQARALTRWCPSHAGLAGSEVDASSLNFHPVRDGWIALSRTVYGGPEYSSRGGLQVVTRILLMRGQQLAAYDWNPVVLAQVVLALGYLRLEPHAPENLPVVDLPDRPLRIMNHASSPDAEVVMRLSQCASVGKRAAVMGTAAPLVMLADLFAYLPAPQRLDFSFTTGLKPSMNRPFKLHFLPSADLALQQQLVSQRITVIQ